ncbi:MAG: zf-TFIIB domain-containing protein [Acidobacteria bacterium]|nr:zf-TFIIB domain-containing protein [Acidobacteriota bacterium]
MSDIFDDRKKALEEDYFRRKEQESIEKLRQKMAAEQQADEQEAKRLECPRGDGKMNTLTFEGVEIDRCDVCGGVWLDKGELEQLRQKEDGGWFSRWK